MEFPSLSLEFYRIPCRLPILLWRGVGQTFGRTWKTIHHTAHQLYQLMLLINKTVSACFVVPMPSPHLDPDPEFRRWKSSCQEEDFPQLDPNLQILCEFDEELPDTEEEDDSPDSSFNLDFNKEDPLNSMGAVALDLDLDFDKRMNELKSGAIVIEDEILDIVSEIVDPALDLLKRMETLEPKTLQDYLILTEQLEKRHLPVKRWNSAFEKNSSEGHQLIQTTRASLEEKRNELEKELSIKMMRHYKPNNNIPGDGHCLFWSIDDQVKGRRGAKYYRKLAADFIRNHPDDFESGVADALSSRHVKGKMATYTRTQGGKKAWIEKLEKKLGRTPTEVDFYCDCLENSTLWGGINEIIALSEELKISILVFSQNHKTWRFDSRIGLSKFKEFPILLHYNGTNHYRSLIPK